MCHRILLLIVSSLSYYFNALISGHPEGKRGGYPGESPDLRSFAQRRLQIPPTQNQNCLTKSY